MNKDGVGRMVSDFTKEGKSKEEIYITLLQKGFKVNQIEEGFSDQFQPENDEETQKKTIKIILTVAAILIGAGIFSFVASNWQEMSRTLKIALIILGMLTSYYGGWKLKEKGQMEKTAEALILLGSLIYGAGIFLVAQMFNIRANWPDGFILWMFGVTVMAYVLNSYTLYYLAIILGLISVFSHPFIISGNSAGGSFLLTSTTLLFFATLLTFLLGISVRKQIPTDIKDDL